ncbi:MAG: hypothetical protein JWR51_4598 [Devosia sp.]|uniref:hypothetical protein n=1 Tax=Devosia sp. TaxID=1871048 RepID=UPI00262E28E1|nr:hypothetical protein [Devosia sp.]MDB5531495.1 hypothetical protein [Devosia sp.]
MTLVRKVSPYPDESLPGLIARAAGTNVYRRAFDVLMQAGIGELRPEYIASRDAGIAERLADVLGTTAELLEPLFHGTASADADIEFFGARLRVIHRESKIRRVSPRALAKAPYIRAVWHLRPLGFDPSTRERLLSACPVCGTPLGFTHTRGVAFCDSCEGTDDIGLPIPTVDLRDFPQPLVEVTDMAALDFVTGLVDPSPDVRDRFAPMLHDDIASVARGDLFEMVLAIASALEKNADPAYVPASEKAHRAGTREVDPDHLAAAGRALLNWPDGFVELAMASRAGAASRPLQWGVLKEIGAIGNLTRDPHVPSEVITAFDAGIREYFAKSKPIDGIIRRSDVRTDSDLIGAKRLRELAQVGFPIITKLADHPDVRTIRQDSDERAPILFSIKQMDYVLGDYKDLETEGVVGTRLGIPPDGLRDLERAGYLRRVKGVPSEIAAPDIYYSRQQTDDICDITKGGLALRPKPAGFIPLSEAMLMFPAGRRPWLAVLEEIWEGRIEAVFHRRVSKSLLAAISVRDMESRRGNVLRRMSNQDPHDVGSVTTASANLMLGNYDYPSFTALLKAELLSLDDGGRVPYAQVIELAGRFIFANEAGVRSGRGTGQVRDWLATHVVAPEYDLGVKNGLLFDRANVEPLLDMNG